MKCVDLKYSYIPFGGITVIFGGDFRKILLVITYGSRSDIVSACITRSKLWNICKIFVLQQNMRLSISNNVTENDRIKKFAEWVLDVGNGNIEVCDSHLDTTAEFRIKIPTKFCNMKDSCSNLSVDRAQDFGGSDAELDVAFPTKYLVSLTVPGLPNHNLKLKEGCEVICGSFVGTQHFIPRMECCPSDTKLPFKLIRKQMPLQICYAMTINKSQGQCLEMVGLFLPKGVFTHGQLYVAISRVTSPDGLKIFIDDETVVYIILSLVNGTVGYGSCVRKVTFFDKFAERVDAELDA
ncbi:uncharacterized protein LOC141691121 [Apium graveolens]|uniref:uncharacterized protein LOC141691121 n=1 Tax=Apium graveolens TaxID=4045 RepID=UPI003D790079